MITIINKCISIWLLITYTCVSNASLQNTLSCGRKQSRNQQLIVYGHDTAPGEWPWHAAIFRKSLGTDSYICGGTLISELFVLTAAHCVKGENGHQISNRRISVRLGVHNLFVVNTEMFQQHAVHKIHQPSDDTSQSMKNDIAILELETVAQFNSYVQPACLSSIKDFTGKLGTVIGWGWTENDEVSAKLKSASIPAIGSMACLRSSRSVFGATLDEGIFCAGYTNETSVCNGDSGGGMFFSTNDVWFLGGIVSFAPSRSFADRRCDTREYTAFTKVPYYLQWISSTTKLNFTSEEELSTNIQRNDDTVFNQSEHKVGEIKGNFSNLLPRHCGGYINNRIMFGKKSKVFEFPWMAMLMYQTSSDKHLRMLCAGTLVNQRYVLTAAHCFLVHLVPIKVVLGEHTIGREPDCNELGGEKECAPPVREFGIEFVIQHHNYRRRDIANDIALIRLDKNVCFEDHIQPVCLPVTKALRKLRLSNYILTGWGSMENDKLGMTLRKARVTAANNSDCQNGRFQLGDDNFCVGEASGPRACTGDSGGPSGYPVRYNGIRFVQFGIISDVAKCPLDGFSIHTKLANYMKWIIANMKP